MHCREVKKAIAEGKIDSEITAHCCDCPDCQRLLRAARLTDHIFDSLPADEAAPSLAAVRRQIESRLKSQTRLEIIMASIKEQVHSRPRLMVGLGMATIILAVCTLIPFSYNQTVGYNVAFCCVNESQPEIRDVLLSNLAASGYDRARVEYERQRDLSCMTVRDLPSEAAAEYYAKALTLVTSDVIEAEIQKVTHRRAATLYAQAREEIRQAQEEKKKPAPMRLFLTLDEALNINDFNIGDLIYSDSLSDQELASRLRDAFAGEDLDQIGLRVTVNTNYEMRERMIIVGSEASWSATSAEDDYLTLGVKEGEYFVKIAKDTITTAAADSGGVEIIIPSSKRDFKGRGMVMKVYLPLKKAIHQGDD